MYLNKGIFFPQKIRDVKKLIGKKIRFLEKGDIDKSGRGYFFPQSGTITEACGWNVWIDNNPKWISDIIEYEVLE